MPLHSKILLGLAIGAVLGVAANLGLGPDHWLVVGLDRYLAGPAGQVFLRMLSMVVMPLVFASIALGVASVGDVRRIGRMGAKTLAYFLGTTGLATALGLVLVRIVEPGAHISAAVRETHLHAEARAVVIQLGKRQQPLRHWRKAQRPQARAFTGWYTRQSTDGRRGRRHR